MADNKFERDYDRQILLADRKARILDLLANGQLLPEVDIYDPPLRYFKANEQWCAILFGFLAWLEDVAGWQEAEEDDFSGIQQILKFEEGIDIFMATQSELEVAIHAGMYAFMQDLAKQIVSGVTSNFSVDENGNVVPGGPGQEPLPEDDPATILNESLSAKAGAAWRIAFGVNSLFIKLNELYGSLVAPATPLATAQRVIRDLYYSGDANATFDQYISDYYDRRSLSLPVVVDLDQDALSEWIYCHNLSHLPITEYILETVAQIDAAFNAIDLYGQILEDYYGIWYDEGITANNSDYLDYYCVPIPDYSFTIQWQDPVAFEDPRVWKKNHRVQVTVQGYLSDDDGNLQDAFWHKASGENEEFFPADFNIQQGGASEIIPSVFEAAYSGLHKYSWTINMGSIDASPQWHLARNGIMLPTATSPTGGLLIQVHDLGAYK